MKKYLIIALLVFISHCCLMIYKKYDQFGRYTELSVVQIIKNQLIEGLFIIPELYVKAAILDEPQAQHELANKYRQGRGFFDVNCAKFVEWNTKAAKKNYADAQYILYINSLEDWCGSYISTQVSYEWLLKAAYNGNLDAQYELVKAYQNNWLSYTILNQVPHQKWAVDTKKRYLELAKKGNAHAQYMLSRIYLEGTDKEYSEWEKWLITAGENGDMQALKSLAVKSMDAEKHQKYKHFLQAFRAKFFQNIEQGNYLAVYYLANWYQDGTLYGVEKNQDKAKNLYLVAAQRGEPIAMLIVAGQYKKEGNTDSSQYWLEKYKAWLLTAVDNNVTDAIEVLALHYQQGKYFQKNPIKVFSLLLKASQLGSSTAMSRIANLYLEGVDGVVTRDVVEAEKWFLKSLKHGNQDALLDLALMYQKGVVGLNQNLEKAEKYLTQYGSLTPYFAYNLAYIYDDGVRIGGSQAQFIQDKQKAFFWYLKAAELGIQKAQWVVSRKYKAGIGVVADNAKAEYWLKVCCSKPDWDFDYHQLELMSIKN